MQTKGLTFGDQQVPSNRHHPTCSCSCANAQILHAEHCKRHFGTYCWTCLYTRATQCSAVMLQAHSIAKGTHFEDSYNFSHTHYNTPHDDTTIYSFRKHTFRNNLCSRVEGILGLAKGVNPTTLSKTWSRQSPSGWHCFHMVPFQRRT